MANDAEGFLLHRLEGGIEILLPAEVVRRLEARKRVELLKLAA